jgi:hypothetical protein
LNRKKEKIKGTMEKKRGTPMLLWVDGVTKMTCKQIYAFLMHAGGKSKVSIFLKVL